MNRSTVLITGSHGFLGQAIARGLKERYRVIGLDFVESDQSDNGIETIKVDLASDESVRSAIEKASRLSGGRFASVIHLAAYYDTTGEDNPKYDAVTVRGTERLLSALKDLGTEQFVFSSTLLVHAPSSETRGRINEDSPLDPPWAYPRSKAETERLIAEERGEIKAVILRLAGVYDEDCRAAFIAQQIARIFERRPTAYLFAGDINAGQPYLHKEDFVDALVRTVDRRAELPDETVLLIGEEETPSYGEMQKRIGRLVHGEDWQTLALPKNLTKAGSWFQTELLGEDTDIKSWMIENSDDHYEIDTSRARQLLGWRPRHSLIATLPEMIRRLKADPTDWYEKNKLQPDVVAASYPELEQARQRLAGALERSEDEVEAAAEAHRYRTLWAPMTNVALGLWLVTSPMTIGLFDPITVAPPPALGHEAGEPGLRNAMLGISEIVSGAFVAVFALLGMYRRWNWVQWITATVGLWIMLAPLVFWTTSAAAYGLDTLIGMLVITFAVMIPPTPGISRRALAADDDRPLGWSYSPSSFTQRIPIVTLAFVGLFVSRYLAAYQMGHIDALWDPFFGSGATPAVANGSEAVVTSWVSKAFPIADAGLGALAYGLDILAGAIGDRRRWRTMPWMVFLFGLLIIPLGVISVSFIIIQPPLIGALCTLCIFQAAVTMALIPYSIDEVLATIQYLWQAKKAGEPFWRTFWTGGPALSENQTPEPDLSRPASTVLRDFITGGVNFPWTLVTCTGLGILLMITPLLAGTSPPPFSDHIAGCIVILIAVTSMAEVVRPVRFLNMPLGAWVGVSPFLFEGGTVTGTILNVAIGLALIGLSLPRGARSDAHYGGWDRAIV